LKELSARAVFEQQAVVLAKHPYLPFEPEAFDQPLPLPKHITLKRDCDLFKAIRHQLIAVIPHVKISISSPDGRNRF